MMENSVSFRNLMVKDKIEITRICFETAFLGKHGQDIFDDPNLFFDMGFYYFIRFDTKYSFVAEADGVILGYILGTPSLHKYFWINGLIIVPFFFLPKLITFRYKVGFKTLKFVLFLLLDALFRKIPRSNASRYPAELHINLSEKSRGKGIASQLMKKLLEQLQENQIKGIQLNTTSENKDALKLYYRFGFKDISQKQSFMWSKYLSHPVNNLTLAKEL